MDSSRDKFVDTKVETDWNKAKSIIYMTQKQFIRSIKKAALLLPHSLTVRYIWLSIAENWCQDTW